MINALAAPNAIKDLWLLGLGTHNVAVPLSKFKLVDKKLDLPGATKDSLKASPPFQYTN
jgi:hypothetical protein